MMIHDHCHACGVKRSMLLGYLIAGADDASAPLCQHCIADFVTMNVDSDDDFVWVMMFAMDVHGYYGRVYPYDGLVADLEPSYRPEAFRWN